ncbi:MAG TPA: hypothetical protein VFI17_03095 [Solirubrobacterales bacterium]|nr:hypothetical protein [Solirubrobacterales bacterium]
MMSPREQWTDERLDDLNKKVDRGFDRIDERFDRIDERFDRMQNTLVASAAVIVAALIGSNAF